MRFAHAFAVLALAATLSAAAAVPAKMSYQGYLTSLAGVPVNATVNMTLKLYDAPTAGNLIWSETQSVTVANGVYNVVLGNTTPLDETVLNGPRYLTVAVAPDGDMAPRTPLASAPYAILAKALDGTISPSQISAPIGTALIEDGAVTFAKIGSGGCAPGKVIKRTASAWDCGDDIDTTGGSVTASSPLQVTGSNVALTGTVAVANGGTGLSSITTNGLIYGQGASAPAVTAAGSLGQVLTATAGGVPQWSNSAPGGLAIFHPTQVAVQGVTFIAGDVALGPASKLSVGGNQVVAAQQLGLANAPAANGITVADTGPTLVVTVEEFNVLSAKMNALLNRLRAHGLIAASGLTLGSACSAPDECESNGCAGGVCVILQPNGAACTSPGICASNLCIGSICVAPGATGTSCSFGNQCFSGVCTLNLCQ